MNSLTGVNEIIAARLAGIFVSTFPAPKMKKIIIISFATMIALTSCSIASTCPTYSNHNKKTKYSQKALSKYHKHTGEKRTSLI
jgi:hypothetical protein